MILSCDKASGSISIFLAFLFMLMLSLILVSFDSARYFASEGYVTAVAQSAAMTAFGDYNKELYEEYGLYGYGGFNGMGILDLQEQICDTMQFNLQEEPEKAIAHYIRLWNISGVDVSGLEGESLTQEEVFWEQINQWWKANVMQNAAEKLKNISSGVSRDELNRRLREGRQAEQEGQRNQEQEASGSSGSAGSSGSGLAGNSGSGSDRGSANDSDNGAGGNTTDDEAAKERAKARKEAKKKLREDEAGGNPISFIRELLGKGVLSLVCDTGSLSEEIIESREISGEEGTQRQGDGVESDTTAQENDGEAAAEKTAGATGTGAEQEDTTGAEVLEKVLGKGGSTGSTEVPVSGRRAKFAAYSHSRLSSYVEPGNQRDRYQQEYLIAGKDKESENLAGVVSRLLLVRTLINYAYVSADPALQEKSMATAAIIAALFLSEELAGALQQTILIVLSLEEACVDICALLQGRRVPLVKNKTNFRMNYGDICRGSRHLFEEKATVYAKDSQELLGTHVGREYNYSQYLFVMTVMIPAETLQSRCLDVIQDDLRKRINQSFTMDTVLARVRGTAGYEMSYVNPFRRGGSMKRAIHMEYGY